MAIPDNKHAVMNLPVHEAMQEGRRMEAVVERYYDQLVKSDINPLYLTSISTRAGAFAYCVSVMDSFVKIGENNMERYLALKSEGYSLRSELISRLAYLFRNENNVQYSLGRIREGRGDLDMIQDLLALNKRMPSVNSVFPSH